ncbi:MAG TPA: CPBP family glutamic-type intramembrane protease [Piscinibacter sp.]|nr:CPBP family glutamic-type intramembrane protease [Piscinibacter sp.]
MEYNTQTSAQGMGTAPLLRRAWPLALLGTIAVLSLLLQPVPAELLAQTPELAALPPLAQRAVLLANPSILVLVAAFVGAALAHRVGLRSVLAGTALAAGWTGIAVKAAAGGFALGLVLAAADAAAAPLLGPAWQALVASAPGGAVATVMGVLYGGVAEEVMLRWGAMSLVAWALALLLPSEARTVSMALAVAMAALLFAAGHLPAVAAQLDLTPAIVTRTLVLNGLAGLLYGWLFWRRHLEAAMVAHACTHLGLAAWRLLAT